MKSNKKTEQKTPVEIAQAQYLAKRKVYAENRLAILNARLGPDIGAKRERERLAKILAS